MKGDASSWLWHPPPTPGLLGTHRYVATQGFSSPSTLILCSHLPVSRMTHQIRITDTFLVNFPSLFKKYSTRCPGLHGSYTSAFSSFPPGAWADGASASCEPGIIGPKKSTALAERLSVNTSAAAINRCPNIRCVHDNATFVARFVLMYTIR